MWCVADLNEEYIARMEDVLALYERPLSETEPVVCVDEKPVVLHADVRPARPMRPGRILRRDSEDKRCFVAPRAHKFAVIGDEAVHAKCGDEFWRQLADAMAGYFRRSEFTPGIIHGVQKAGELLAEHFPRHRG